MTRVAMQVGQQWLMVSCQMMNRWLRLNALPLGLLLSVNNVTLQSSLNGPGAPAPRLVSVAFCSHLYTCGIGVASKHHAEATSILVPYH